MWHPKIRLILTTIAAGFGLFTMALNAKADHQRWCSYGLSCLSHRSSRDWAGEAASLGVIGGAPSLGFSGSVTGYEQGIIRVPFPAQGTAGVAAGGVSGSSELPAGAVPPTPATSVPAPLH
jgi:outer membrane lipoprotein SlyB